MSWKETAKVRAWSLRYVFLLFFVKPTVLEVTEQRCEVVIPLNWRTKNHLKSMYFGALCIGADVAGGLICFPLMSGMQEKLFLALKSVRAEFLERPVADAHYSSEAGGAVQRCARRAIARRARV